MNVEAAKMRKEQAADLETPTAVSNNKKLNTDDGMQGMLLDASKADKSKGKGSSAKANKAAA